MSPSEEAAQILVQTFEALARLHGKRLSEHTKARLGRACELLSSSGEELDDLLEDVPTPPRRSPGEAAIDDDEFQRWRNRRAS